jgi:hypothetical protein
MTAILSCLFLSLPLSIEAADWYIWDLAGDGNRSVAANWGPDHVPNGASDRARIDGDPAQDVTVYLDTAASVSGLELNSGDTLSINNARTLSLIQDEFATDPTIANNGTITLDSGGTYRALEAAGSTATLTGNGSVVMGGNIWNYLDATTGGSIVNETSHTIRGGGTIRSPLTNNGNIIADNQILRFEYGITGNGGICVADGATLDLRQSSETGTFT